MEEDEGEGEEVESQREGLNSLGEEGKFRGERFEA